MTFFAKSTLILIFHRFFNSRFTYSDIFAVLIFCLEGKHKLTSFFPIAHHVMISLALFPTIFWSRLHVRYSSYHLEWSEHKWRNPIRSTDAQLRHDQNWTRDLQNTKDEIIIHYISCNPQTTGVETFYFKPEQGVFHSWKYFLRSTKYSVTNMHFSRKYVNRKVKLLAFWWVFKFRILMIIQSWFEYCYYLRSKTKKILDAKFKFK